MAFSLTWLPEVLTRAGLKISEVEGWQNRGRGDMGRVFGVICHHTAGPRTLNMPSLKTLINGRGGSKPLPGPLAQLGLARDGTYFIIAAGRANHAGTGSFRDPATGRLLANGNSNFIGIEAENTGLPNDSPWPAVQVEAYQRGVAAILKHVRQTSDFCLGHKEWAGPRKPDPAGFDMADFRGRVAQFMSGAATVTLIPPVEPEGPNGAPGRPTLRRGMTGPLTRQLQAKLKITVDGSFGPRTEAAVRAFQRAQKLVPDGIVGPKTWKALDAIP